MIFSFTNISESIVNRIVDLTKSLQPISDKVIYDNFEMFERSATLLRNDYLTELLEKDLKYLWHIGRVIKKYSKSRNNELYIKEYSFEVDVINKEILNYVEILFSLRVNNRKYGKINIPVLIYKNSLNEINYIFCTSFAHVKQVINELL